ncbi:MAG TPA: arabinofuranosidase catalytic domain-containing protein [Opitutaceae bacterium]|nr:arabinofuranosidase catalytic domain-containing protein [Opitutaceae bacterium]
MKTKKSLLTLLGLALVLPVVTLLFAAQSAANRNAPARPQGPCDIYAAGGAPCVAAHSSTRALLAAYNGPLYQVMRQSDGKTLDIGVVQPTAGPVPDAGGYADAAAQDAFCANTACWITTLYDQSGKGNHLTQAPRGAFSGPGMGGFNNLPIADMAPVTVLGHKVYGVFIEPGMGLRWNDAKGTAVDDQAEGQYWVINGQHYNNGCCFDYGNAETDSRDDGNGTMETTYYGNSTGWYHGPAPGPWVMTDQENNLVGCVNPDGSKNCPTLPSMTSRFVTGVAKGEPHHWTSLGGDAQRGDLQVMFDGGRVNQTYDPMRKQGAILLGNGGDNSNGSQGTFYEGAMTAGGTFPSDATDRLVQANVVAAKYDVARVSVAPASAVAAPPGLQTFSPGGSQETAVQFTNTTGAPATNVALSLAVPAGWTSAVVGGSGASKTFAGPVAPGATVSATFKITSGSAGFNGDLVARAAWTGAAGQMQSESAAEKVRNVSPVKINEFATSSGTPANPTNAFIELYNAGTGAVDLSNWTLTEHPTQLPIFSSVKIPAGTKLAAKGFYLLGLSNSGLAAPAAKGDAVIHVRSTAGMNVGDTIEIDTGSSVETRRIASLGTAAGAATTLWQPLPDGPVITLAAGSTNVPVTNAAGFEVGQKIGLGFGTAAPAVARTLEQYEVATVTAVGKQGTQAWLAADAKAGDTNIKVSALGDISAGDQIRLDIDSNGHGIETVTVTKVGTAATGRPSSGKLTEVGTGLELSAPLKFAHAANIPFSARGTGITFTPATKVVHASNEPVLPLGSGITLDRPLERDHAIDAVLRDAAVTTAGYQGAQAPDQWFGGPALAPSAGNIVLRDAAGLVVDSLNYGNLVDPWSAEGYQGVSGTGQGGCRVTAPSAGPGRGGPAIAPTSRSAGRFPDGADTDSNCGDFQLQAAATLPVASSAGANNIKVGTVADFAPGQTLILDTGANRETAVIATIGTAGGTSASAATAVGATVIPVSNPAGFVPGQAIVVDRGVNQETGVVASVAGGARGGRGPANASLTLAAPLKNAHAAGADVAGTGITFTTALTHAHESGAQITDELPTPGAPNHYTHRTP